MDATIPHRFAAILTAVSLAGCGVGHARPPLSSGLGTRRRRAPKRPKVSS